MLSKVIKEAKQLKYDNKIQNYKNKNNSIWDIVKLETNKVSTTEKISTLNVEVKWIRKKQMIAETFNNYFLSVVNNVITLVII
jgi:hypothetical protein